MSQTSQMSQTSITDYLTPPSITGEDKRGFRSRSNSPVRRKDKGKDRKRSGSTCGRSLTQQDKNRGSHRPSKQYSQKRSVQPEAQQPASTPTTSGYFDKENTPMQPVETQQPDVPIMSSHSAKESLSSVQPEAQQSTSTPTTSGQFDKENTPMQPVETQQPDVPIMSSHSAKESLLSVQPEAQQPASTPTTSGQFDNENTPMQPVETQQPDIPIKSSHSAKESLSHLKSVFNLEVSGNSVCAAQAPMQDTVFDALKSWIKVEQEKNFKFENMKVFTKDKSTGRKWYFNLGAPASILDGKDVNVVFQKLKKKCPGNDSDLCRSYDHFESEDDIKQLSHFKLKFNGRENGSYYPQKDSLLIINFLPNESIRDALVKDKRIDPALIPRFNLEKEGTARSVLLGMDADAIKNCVLVVTGHSKKGQPVTQVQASELDGEEQNSNNVGIGQDNGHSYFRKQLSEKWGLVSEQGEDKSEELRFRISNPKLFKNTTKKLLLAQIPRLLLRDRDLFMMRECGQSVGRICCNGIDGTGFRLGTKYLMTCNHVIVRFSADLPLDRAYVLFGNVERDSPGNKIYIKSVVFSDDFNDFAIIEMNEEQLGEMPPQITRFGEVDPTKSLCFIGHPQGHERVYNPSCYIEVNPEKKFAISFSLTDTIFVQSGVKANYQTAFEEGGSSGSPGFDSDYKLVLMHASKHVIRDNDGNIKSIVEQGISIAFIKNYLLNHVLAQKSLEGMVDQSVIDMINSCFGEQVFSFEEIN